MIGFLKNFFAGEKTAAEQALAGKKHDVLSVEGYAMDEACEDEKETAAPQGCCGGGCR